MAIPGGAKVGLGVVRPAREIARRARSYIGMAPVVLAIADKVRSKCGETPS